MIDVRVATIGDADAIAGAHIEGWRVGYRGLVPDVQLDSPEFTNTRRERWRAWTWQNQAGVELFVVAIDGEVAGFALTGPERVDHDDARPSPARGEVYAFYLHPDAWGSGGALPLMRRCEQALRDAGYVDAVLWVLRDNRRARRFYEKAGWTFTGQESDFTPSDAPDNPLPEVQYGVAL